METENMTNITEEISVEEAPAAAEAPEATETPVATEAAEAPVVGESAETPEVVETMEDYSKELEASFRKISEGDILSGTVIHVNEEEVTLDLDYFAPGVIKAADLSRDPSFSILADVHVGDKMQGTVIKIGRAHV